ncbi:LTA synthase family protein [Desulfosporosinus nitroreducens]|uniref:LTA synthase family protein n=1 Tax=Desulfosporosinus nitroreducens TaxID=2018668 RepID=A0ABT8QTR5_9FIRM|nr:LTA synthase family protein [Desulfosporosinus nitroreducens]MDO0824753.1 LTA synthase family protein [Desulfosporosinus nitroreducens]
MFLPKISSNVTNFKFYNGLLNLSLITCLPLFMLFSLETVYRGGISSTLSWIAQYSKQFLLSYVLMFGVINFFYVFKRKIYISMGVLFLSFFSLIGLISRQKLIWRGEPLLPWDLILGKEALIIAKEFSGTPELIPLLYISVITISLLLSVQVIPKEVFNWRGKLAPFAISLALLISFYSGVISLEKTFSLQQINWSQKLNYEENGMLLGFILNTTYLSVDKPDNYEQELVKEIISNTTPSYIVDPNFKPNIIFVMSEAFWDPTLLKEVSFSEDPIPYFRSLQKDQTSGVMLSPVYGGGTANTEFEVLTGLSTQFLPKGVVPYVEYLRKPIDALPAVLKKQGYETTAIHTYDNWFYGRNNVYKNLAFDKFISKEFFDQPEYNGPYIRDTELSQRILSEMKKTEKPDFVYAVSMQAHGPYSAEETPENSVKVSGDISPSSRAILENYTQIISDVDQSLKLLIEGLEQLSEPSIAVFFGDHLPMLGTNFDVYQEANFFQDELNYQDYLNMYSVPFVVWDNFSNDKEELRISSNFLSSYILERAKKPGSPTTDFLHSLIQNGSSVVISEHHLQREDISQKEISQYQLLQYDILFGNEYAYLIKPDHKPQVNSDYIVGDGRALIVNASPPNTSVIEITGENFLFDHKVYINGQLVQTDFENPTYITASLPKRLNNKSGALDIQIKLTDSMGNVISESNTFKLDSFSNI